MVEYLFIAMSAVLIIICIYLVASPFFTREFAVEKVSETDKSQTIEAIYGAVNELEMDFLMKKISEEDFLDVKNKYQAVATELLSHEGEKVSISKQKHESSVQTEMIDDELLKELEEIRRSKERRGK